MEEVITTNHQYRLTFDNNTKLYNLYEKGSWIETYDIGTLMALRILFNNVDLEKEGQRDIQR